MRKLFLSLIIVLLASPAYADDYAEATNKALAIMAMNHSNVSQRAPHNWCHCGHCESIADATTQALQVMSYRQDHVCERCNCNPCLCPVCVCDGAYVWKKTIDDPGRWYLHYQNQLLGGWDEGNRYYRRYYPPPIDRWGAKEYSVPANPFAHLEQRPAYYVPTVGFGGGCAGGSCGRRR